MRTLTALVALLAALIGGSAPAQDLPDAEVAFDAGALAAPDAASEAIVGLWRVGLPGGAEARFEEGGAFTYYEETGEEVLGDWDIRAGSAGTLELVTWPPVWPDVTFGDIETFRFLAADRALVGETLELSRVPDAAPSGPGLDEGAGPAEPAPAIGDDDLGVEELPAIEGPDVPFVPRDFAETRSAAAFDAEAVLIGRWNAPDVQADGFVEFQTGGVILFSENGIDVESGAWRVVDDESGGLTIVVSGEDRPTERDSLEILSPDRVLVAGETTLLRIHEQTASQPQLSAQEAAALLVGVWVGEEFGERGEITFLANGRLEAFPPGGGPAVRGRWDVIEDGGGLAVRAWRDDRGSEPEIASLEVMGDDSIIIDGELTLSRLSGAPEPFAPSADEAETLLVGVWEERNDQVLIEFSVDGRFRSVLEGDFAQEEAGRWSLEPTLNGALSLVLYRDGIYEPSRLGTVYFITADRIETADGAVLERSARSFAPAAPADDAVAAEGALGGREALAGVWRGEFDGRLAEVTFTANDQVRFRDLSAEPIADGVGVWDIAPLSPELYDVVVTLRDAHGTALSLRVRFLTPDVIEVETDGVATVMRRLS